MFTLLDPITADLIFTIATSVGLLITGAASIALLPWTQSEIEATEHAFSSILTLGESVPSRVQATR